MNKTEILNYLMEKRQLTAPVANAENNWRRQQSLYQKVKKKWWVVIAILALFTITCVNMMVHGDMRLWVGKGFGGLGGFLVFGSLTAFFSFKKYKQQTQAKEALTEAEETIRQEKSRPEYQNGLKGFPEKFYHYSELYRLWKLIDEERVETLKEAYNLLETQHFYEDQTSIQEEIRSLQQDIANSGRVTAAASVVSAYNTHKIRRKM